MTREAPWEGALRRLERILERGEGLLGKGEPAPPDPAIFRDHWAFRWERAGGGGRIVPIETPHRVDLSSLVGIDRAKDELLRNTAQFVEGFAANHVLLWGERGTGKSSCVKGLLGEFGARGLRIVELARWDLFSFPKVAGHLRRAPFRFILFCDDLSFDEGEADFRGLKTLLDGGVEERPENVLIYATSNRRHLMPEKRVALGEEEEIHPEEAAGEKLSLSDRFGLQLGFYRFDQDTYLDAVESYARRMRLPVDPAPLREEALRWALDAGSRSGRTAKQFIDDLSGRLGRRGT
ncbi:MAG: ATP-binding protein [Deltaproteobacteria bacterium]|nr:ATP-binding protein [Deltaproteobacteria bacterium]